MSDCIATGLEQELRQPAYPEIAGTLQERIDQVRLRMACAEDLFNNTTEDAMLDSCIYQLKSLQVYYSFLLRELRNTAPAPAPREQSWKNRVEALMKERVVETMG